MVNSKVFINSFGARNDGFKEKKAPLNPIVVKYKRRFVLKPVAETGEYIEKSEIYKFEEYDIHKAIQAEAVGSTLYEILDRVILDPNTFADRGDEGVDLSMIGQGDDLISVKNKMNNISLDKIDDSLKGIDPVKLATMSDAEILAHVRAYRESLNKGGNSNENE